MDLLEEIQFVSLIDWLGRQIQERGEQIAIVTEERAYSYSEFAAIIESAAAQLASTNLRDGATVALMLPNGVEFCAWYFAALSLGARVFPVNIMLPPSELASQFQQARVESIIFWDAFADSVQEAAHMLQPTPQMRRLSEMQLQIEPGGNNTSSLLRTKAALRTEDEALVQFTAGTAGTPRGAVFTQGSLSLTVRNIWETLLISDSDRILAILPLFHPFGQLVSMAAPLVAGATVVLHARLDIAAILESIEQHGITCFPAVPAVFDEIARIHPELEKLTSLRVCLATGAPLRESTYKIFVEDYGITILEGYGLTECSPLVSCSRIYYERRRESVGLPLPDIDIAIFSPEGVELPPGEPGEIAIQSPCLMKKYLGDIAAPFANGYFLTGDIGYVDAEGYLYYLERKDDLIVKDGFFILPNEIEQILIAHPKVKDCAVIGLKDRSHGEIIRAYLVPEEGETVTAHEIRYDCKSQLPAYKVPDQFSFVDHLPRTPTGKILKRDLRQALQSTSRTT